MVRVLWGLEAGSVGLIRWGRVRNLTVHNLYVASVLRWGAAMSAFIDHLYPCPQMAGPEHLGVLVTHPQHGRGTKSAILG